MTRSPRVTVWNEFRHERTNPQVRAVYPDGIHEALAAPLRAAAFRPRMLPWGYGGMEVE